MWAVWKSGIMQKMAKYQMEHLKVFSGFFVPYLSKSQKKKVKAMRKSKSRSGKNIKVNVKSKGSSIAIALLTVVTHQCMIFVAAGTEIITVSVLNNILVVWAKPTIYIW
jgi:hypothetical protein